MNYSKLEREYKKMSKLKFNDEERRLNITFQSNHFFVVSNKTYKKTVKKCILFIVVFLMIISIQIYSVTSNQIIYSFLDIIYSLFFLMISLLISYDGYNLTHHIYPKTYFNYCTGQVEYCNGKKTYNFNVKDVFSIRFKKPYYRSSRWIIDVKLKWSYEVISIDILNMNNPEIIFRLLTNFNKDILI